VNEFFAVLLVLLLAVSGYIAGRMHGQYSYHVGYRFGYRHGYYDGDRASWNRRRRELQNAVASVLREPETPRQAGPGTTYASAAYGESAIEESPAADDGSDGSVVAEGAARWRRPRGWPTAGGVRRA
jgi:hypothetical protein